MTGLNLDFDVLQRELYTGVICDVLDSLDLRHQAMEGDVRPVHPDMALAGRVLSTASRARGARGAVMDGYVRDVRRIVDMRFPVFAAGMRPVDSRTTSGRVRQARSPLT